MAGGKNPFLPFDGNLVAPAVRRASRPPLFVVFETPAGFAGPSAAGRRRYKSKSLAAERRGFFKIDRLHAEG